MIKRTDHGGDQSGFDWLVLTKTKRIIQNINKKNHFMAHVDIFQLTHRSSHQRTSIVTSAASHTPRGHTVHKYNILLVIAEFCGSDNDRVSGKRRWV